MSRFWLTKAMVETALAMSAEKPANTFICFEGSSENNNEGVEYTKMIISVGSKKRTVRQRFDKIIL